jgi:hypothetical protein
MTHRIEGGSGNDGEKDKTNDTHKGEGNSRNDLYQSLYGSSSIPLENKRSRRQQAVRYQGDAQTLQNAWTQFDKPAGTDKPDTTHEDATSSASVLPDASGSTERTASSSRRDLQSPYENISTYQIGYLLKKTRETNQKRKQEEVQRQQIERVQPLREQQIAELRAEEEAAQRQTPVESATTSQGNPYKDFHQAIDKIETKGNEDAKKLITALKSAEQPSTVIVKNEKTFSAPEKTRGNYLAGSECYENDSFKILAKINPGDSSVNEELTISGSVYDRINLALANVHSSTSQDIRQDSAGQAIPEGW